YRSERYLADFCRRAAAAAERVTPDYEIVLVNDGSPDEVLERARALVRDQHRIRLVDLSRNFGQHQALMTGLAHARGDVIFMLDSDLEEHPEWLADFYRTMQKTKCDLIE